MSVALVRLATTRGERAFHIDMKAAGRQAARRSQALSLAGRTAFKIQDFRKAGRAMPSRPDLVTITKSVGQRGPAGRNIER